MALNLIDNKHREIVIERGENEKIVIEEIPDTLEDIIEENKKLKESLEFYKKRVAELEIEKNKDFDLIRDYGDCVSAHGICFERWKQAYENESKKYGTHDKREIERIDRNIERTRALMKLRKQQKKIEEE